MNFARTAQQESKISVKIRDLSPNMMNIAIIGVVIAKQDLRAVQSKKNPGQERFVLCFTVRDSPVDIINVTCWGEESAVSKCSDKFEIMDIVEIRNPQIQLKFASSSDNRYMPDVNSPFHLNMSAVYSELLPLNNASDALRKLVHFPTKSAGDHLTLADVIYNGQDIDGEHINLLVALRSVGTKQEITTKDGRQCTKLEMVVFDQTHSSFIITIWKPTVIKFVQKLNPMNCVLFISDIKVAYNTCLRKMTGTVDGLTIITPNPEVQEAYPLYHYAQTVDFAIDDNGTASSCGGPSTSAQLFTVEAVRKLLNMGCDISLSGEIQGVIYGLISKLDLDGSSRLFSIRCAKCRQRLSSESDKCTNTNCTMGKGSEKMRSEQIFDFNIWLSDHTGTLKKCYLSGDGAQNFLNCTVEEFFYLSESQKTDLKWQFLLERCKVCFKIIASSAGNPLLYITSCKLADNDEFVRSLS